MQRGYGVRAGPDLRDGFGRMCKVVKGNRCLFLAVSLLSLAFCHGLASSALHSDLGGHPAPDKKMQEERLQGAVAGDKGARACVSALLLFCSGLGGLQELLVC